MKHSIIIASAAVLMVSGGHVIAGNCEHKTDQKSQCSASKMIKKMTSSSAVQGNDIVATAVKAGTFTTLVAALQAADLDGVLQGDGPFTVFAPSDAAFEKLPEGTVATLLKPENKDQLAAILKLHVVSGKVSSKQVVTIDEAKSVGGEALKINADDNGVTVGGAKVVSADIESSNGIIHVIDTVILPQSKS